MIDTNKHRSPSELRNLLEVRVRRQAHTYDVDKRIEALAEIRDLADAAIQHLEKKDT
jgi:hypothetical protein